MHGSAHITIEPFFQETLCWLSSGSDSAYLYLSRHLTKQKADLNENVNIEETEYILLEKIFKNFGER